MSELGEAQWAVVSERGCEASGVNYTNALELMRRLTQEKVSGLCIVTAAAARRFTSVLRASPQPAPKRAAPRKA
ncbi:MAG: hypothetical protein QOF02_3436 [Blastocatellia bacterium]|jgi:hypothetical protein|nr:hypothetical protein [Blastocatellia bacterium]